MSSIGATAIGAAQASGFPLRDRLVEAAGIFDKTRAAAPGVFDKAAHIMIITEPEE